MAKAQRAGQADKVMMARAKERPKRITAKSNFKQLVEPAPAHDLFASSQAEILRGLTKWFFEFLRNVMILGIIKFVADQSGDPVLYGLYVLATAMLLFYILTYIHSWRLRPFAFLGDGGMAKSLDFAISGALAGLLVGLSIMALDIAVNEIAKAQAR